MKLRILASMAHATNPSAGQSRGLLGLFEEAWRRQRRRRGSYALLVLIVLGAAAIVLESDKPSTSQTASTPAVFSRLTSTGLPASGHFASLSQAGGRLVIAGGPGNRPLNVSGTTTSLVHGRAAGRCSAATVIPGTVRLERLGHANCGDPTLYGLHVMPLLLAERTHGPTGLTVEVRIAVADPAAQDGYRLEPPVMSYEQCSDCAAQWTIGDHALWITSALAHGPHGPGEVLRISATSGQVLQRFAIPQLYNVVLATNQDGLWIAPSILTGFAGRFTPEQNRASSALFLIAPGAHAARNVLHVGDGIAWLTASNHRVWLGEIHHGAIRMLTFTGAHANQLRRGPRLRVGRGGGDELGNGATPYAVDPQSAVYGVGSSDNAHQTVITFNTKTLTAHRLTTTPRRYAYDQQADTATTGDSLYFLDAQTGPSGGQLYRLAIR
jgi:hypothetical protein